MINAKSTTNYCVTMRADLNIKLISLNIAINIITWPFRKRSMFSIFLMKINDMKELSVLLCIIVILLLFTTKAHAYEAYICEVWNKVVVKGMRILPTDS